jgi:hypothetical protein
MCDGQCPSNLSITARIGAFIQAKAVQDAAKILELMAAREFEVDGDEVTMYRA